MKERIYTGYAVTKSDFSANSFESHSLEDCKRYCYGDYVIVKRYKKRWGNEVFYGIKCNRCGSIYDGGGDYQYYYDEDNALECAYNDMWIEQKGKHYCPNCYIDNGEDTEYIIKPKYPKHLYVVKDFVNYIMKSVPAIKEMEDNFIINYYEGFRETEDYDIEWLKSRLKDSLISLERKDIDMCRNKQVFISITK